MRLMLGFIIGAFVGVSATGFFVKYMPEQAVPLIGMGVDHLEAYMEETGEKGLETLKAYLAEKKLEGVGKDDLEAMQGKKKKQ